MRRLRHGIALLSALACLAFGLALPMPGFTANAFAGSDDTSGAASENSSTDAASSDSAEAAEPTEAASPPQAAETPAAAPPAPAATPDYYTRRANAELARDRKLDALPPHPLAAAHPGYDVVVCTGGCTRERQPEIVSMRPSKPVVVVESAQMVPSSSDAEAPPPATPTIDCLGGCYDTPKSYEAPPLSDDTVARDEGAATTGTSRKALATAGDPSRISR